MQMPMMSMNGGGMMQMMMGGGRMSGMGGMATIDRVEGRIAFLKTELKITDAQADAWNAFAAALRTHAARLGELRTSMPTQGTLIDRLAWQEKWLTARAEGTRVARTSYAELAAKLSDDQKAAADQILAPHIGMMTMMSATGTDQMMRGGRIGMGAMGSGQMPMTSGKTPMK